MPFDLFTINHLIVIRDEHFRDVFRHASPSGVEPRPASSLIFLYVSAYLKQHADQPCPQPQPQA
jgi:hypothetical protein